MATKAQKVRLSIFLITSMSVFLAFFIFLVGSKLLQRMDRYYVVYRDISITGLEMGAAVKLNGVQVGRVTALSVRDAASVAVEIEVKHKTPIKKNTQAVMTLVGVTGLKYVELSSGTSQAEDLPPGGTIIAGQSVFDTISGKAEVIMVKLEQILNNVNRMTGPETASSLNNALSSFASLSTQLDTLLKKNDRPITSTIASLDTVMTNLAVSTARIDSAMAAINYLINSKDVKNSVSNVNKITTTLKTELDSMKLAETTRSLRELLNSADKMVFSYDQLIVKARDDILKSLSNLEETLDNLREATDVIRENPSVLLRGRKTTGDEF
jgi:phospholipid/cholesterol/gamma-HCH transport system substrate-binding protein